MNLSSNFNLLSLCVFLVCTERSQAQIEVMTKPNSPPFQSSTAMGNSTLFTESISKNGRFMIFASSATNLTALGNAPGKLQLYLYDLSLSNVSLLSSNVSGFPCNGDALSATISSSGRYVAFTSSASDLVNGDISNDTDVFLIDRTTASLRKLQAGGGSMNFLDSEQTLFVGYSGLITRYDLPLGNADTLRPADMEYPAPIPSVDGKLVVFSDHLLRLRIHDFALGTNYLVHTNPVFSKPIVSSEEIIFIDSSCFCYPIPPRPPSPPEVSSLVVYSLTSRSNVIYRPLATNQTRSVIFVDTNYLLLVNAPVSSRIENVFDVSMVLHNIRSGAETTIGEFEFPMNALTPLIFRSSPDGRFILYPAPAFRPSLNRFSTNFSFFVYDRATGKTTQHSEIPVPNTTHTPGTARNFQFLPEMKGIVFESSNSLLVSNDLNQATDLFLLPLGRTKETDSDHDGLSDEWEQTFFHTLEQSAENDPDHDRFSNWQEFIAGTDPSKSDSYFRMNQPSILPGRLEKDGFKQVLGPPSVIFSWTNSPTARYLVEWSNDPGSAQWLPVMKPISVLENQAFFQDQIRTSSARYYRLKILERSPGAF